MGNDLKTSVIVDYKSGLARGAGRDAKSMRGFSRSSSRDMKRLKRNVDSTGSSVSKLGRRMFGLAAGYGAVRKAMQVVDLDARLTQLQTDGRASAEQIAALKKELFAVANDPNIRVDPDKILSGFEEIITRTGDFKFAIDNIKNLGITIRATNSAGEDVGAVFSNLFKGGVRDTKEVLMLMDALVQQTYEGSVAFRDIAKVGNKLFAPYIASGRTGAAAFREMGAVAQIVIDAVGSPDEATEATKSLLSFLNKKDVQKKLGSKGVKVMDKGKMRPIQDLLSEIYKVTKGDAGILGQLFGETGVRVFQGFSLEGNKAKLARLSKLQASGQQLTQSARINATTAKASIQAIKNKISQGTNKAVSGPSKFLADFFDALSSDKLNVHGSLVSALVQHKLRNMPQGGSAAAGPVGKVTVEFQSKDGSRVKVKSIESKNMELEVDSGNERMIGQ